MRRALIGLAVATLTVLALTGPASAAPGPVVMHVTFHGTFANALWSTSSPTSITNTTVNAAQTPHPHGFMLFVDQSTTNLNADGNVTGITDTSFVVTSGFSFVIGKTLDTATLSGSGLPAATCTYDATGILIGCADTTIDVNANWTGQGPLTPTVSNFHFKTAGFIENDHFNGTSRTATATGTVGGLTLNAADLQGATLGTANSGTITICKGNPSFCQ
jgi:hypothetical protein